MCTWLLLILYDFHDWGTFNLYFRMKMPYLQATILECCRKCPVFPLAVAHKLAHDTTFHGYKIPSYNHCLVFANLYSVHMDKNIFPDPEKFDPGHFLSSEGQVINSEYVIPFSVGRSELHVVYYVFTCFHQISSFSNLA